MDLLTAYKAINLTLLAFQSSIVGISLSLPIKSGYALNEITHLLAIIGLVILSPREHYHSVGPSDSLTIYLSTRTFLNISALLLVHGKNPMMVQMLRTILEGANLIVESRSKRDFLLQAYLGIAPEEAAGPLSRATFAWIHPLLFAGKDFTFVLETLPQNPRQFYPLNLRQKFLLFWDQRGK